MAPPITEPQFTDDGRRLHTFRQSSLKTLDLCMERSRLEMSGLMPRYETDAASMGTAVHAAIEAVLREIRDFDFEPPLEDAQQIAQGEFSRLVATPNFQWIQVKEPAARKFIDRAVAKFYDELVPELVPQHMELTFGPLRLYEDSERVIVVTGTIDYVDALKGLCDWKTANRKYEKWEHQRWGIQETVYTWAAHQLGIVDFNEDGVIPFTFYVFMKRQDVEIQRVPIVRHAGDWEWLKQRALTTARLIEAELPQWPLNDNGWWCSSKWCPAWDACKGKTRNAEHDNY